MVKINKQPSDQKEFLFDILVTDKALSSIEQFYNHRYILYEYLYYHHNVCKYDGILMEIISELLKLSVIEDDSFIKDILLRFNFLVANQDKSLSIILNNTNNIYHKVSQFDDCWLRSLLQTLYNEIKGKEKYNILELLLETFLFRKANNTYSLLKKDTDVESYVADFLKYLKDHEQPLYSNFIQHIQSSKQMLSGTITSTYDEHKFLRYLFASYFKDFAGKPIKTKFIKSISAMCKDFGVIFIHKDIAPKLVDGEAKIYFNNLAEDCTKLSPYLDSSIQIKKTSFNHYFGFVSKDIKTSEKENLRNKARSATFTALKDVLSACIEEDYNDIKYLQDKKQEYNVEKQKIASRH